MLLDVQNLVSDQQDLAQTAAAYLSDYSIDLGAAGTAYPGGSVYKNAGAGMPVCLLCQVVVAFSTGSSPTLVVDLVVADNDALSTNLVVLHSTPAIAAATLVAGYQFFVGGTIPPNITKRYLGLRYTIGTATTTTGKITAGLALNLQTAPN